MEELEDVWNEYAAWPYSAYLDAWHSERGDESSFETTWTQDGHSYPVTIERFSEEEFKEAKENLVAIYRQVDALRAKESTPATRLRIEQLFMSAQPLEARMLA